MKTKNRSEGCKLTETSNAMPDESIYLRTISRSAACHPPKKIDHFLRKVHGVDVLLYLRHTPAITCFDEGADQRARFLGCCLGHINLRDT
jgi:hypothetical protein